VSNNIVIADTSGIIAAYDDDEPESVRCRTVLAEAPLLVVSALVLAEIDHVATRLAGRAAARHILADIQYWTRAGRFAIPTITADVLAAAEQTRDRHAAVDLDLADAVNTALAFEYRTATILTLDRRDFRAVTPLTPHKAFTLLPDDL
jgi:predicted nucleic acid-binding protein